MSISTNAHARFNCLRAAHLRAQSTRRLSLPILLTLSHILYLLRRGAVRGLSAR